MMMMVMMSSLPLLELMLLLLHVPSAPSKAHPEAGETSRCPGRSASHQGHVTVR
eukprot:COSAG05_NODE_13541_length_426_cov_0.923547_2_plen_53_part_01